MDDLLKRAAERVRSRSGYIAGRLRDLTMPEVAAALDTDQRTALLVLLCRMPREGLWEQDVDAVAAAFGIEASLLGRLLTCPSMR